MIWFGLVKESEGEIQRMAETNYHAEHICAEALVSALAPAAQPLLSLRSYSIQYITSAAVGFFFFHPRHPHHDCRRHRRHLPVVIVHDHQQRIFFANVPILIGSHETGQRLRMLKRSMILDVAVVMVWRRDFTLQYCWYHGGWTYPSLMRHMLLPPTLSFSSSSFFFGGRGEPSSSVPVPIFWWFYPRPPPPPPSYSLYVVGILPRIGIHNALWVDPEEQPQAIE